MCGECCYGERGITVKDHEIKRIAGFLNISEESFVNDYCQERNGKLYIKTGLDKYCIFFDQRTCCTIHTVKPDVCCLWPFFSAIVADEENWELAKWACPGINPDCSFKKFVKQSKE